MDKNLLIIRKVKHEDAKGWFELHNKVSRDACSYIFPEEDTIYVNDGIINFIGSRPHYEL